MKLFQRGKKIQNENFGFRVQPIQRFIHQTFTKPESLVSQLRGAEQSTIKKFAPSSKSEGRCHHQLAQP